MHTLDELRDGFRSALDLYREGKLEAYRSQLEAALRIAHRLAAQTPDRCRTCGRLSYLDTGGFCSGGCRR